MIVRRDLSPAQQAVQGMHSAIEAARSGLIPSDTPHPHLVFCWVKDEPTLERHAAKLAAAGVSLRRFYEPDRNNELTAVTTAPIHGEQRRLFRNLQLVRDDNVAA